MNEIWIFTLFDSIGIIFFSVVVVVGVGRSCCCFIFISLFRRFTFWPSILSSIFGVRFLRTLSVVDNFFIVLLLDTDVVEPNRRNGDVGMGWKSRISLSGGLPKSCCERF